MQRYCLLLFAVECISYWAVCADSSQWLNKRCSGRERSWLHDKFHILDEISTNEGTLEGTLVISWCTPLWMGSTARDIKNQPHLPCNDEANWSHDEYVYDRHCCHVHQASECHHDALLKAQSSPTSSVTSLRYTCQVMIWNLVPLTAWSGFTGLWPIYLQT